MPVVRLYANLRDILNKDQVSIDAGTVKELMIKMEDMGGKKLRDLMRDSNNELRPNIIILVNGKNARFIKGIDTEINEGDVIDIFPPVAGG